MSLPLLAESAIIVGGAAMTGALPSVSRAAHQTSQLRPRLR
jgi:hypothetical protein